MAWTERYVDPNADGLGNGTTTATSGANGAWTWAQAVANEASGQRINVKAGTYSQTTTTDTLAATGTATAPIWWRGYNTTIGDLDNDPVTSKPSITYTTGRTVVSGAQHILSNLSLAGAFTTGAQLSISNLCMLDRVRVENTNAGASSSSLALTGNTRITRSWFKATSSATRVFETTTGCFLVGSVVEGGGNGVENTSGTPFMCIIGTAFISLGNHGILTSGASTLQVFQCTVANCGGDGIRLGASPAGLSFIFNSLFVSNGGYGINNNSGSNIHIPRVGNAFFGNTSGTENGFGDSPSLVQQTETASPVVSSTDLSFVSGALSVNNSIPGLFENQSYTSYADIGAVQRNFGGLFAQAILDSPMTGRVYV